MSDIILMDNFSSIAEYVQPLKSSPWAKMRYRLLGGDTIKVGIPAVGVLNLSPSLGNSLHPSSALLTELPAEFTRFGTGFKVQNYVAVANRLGRCGNFAVGELTDSTFRPVLILELLGTSLALRYMEGSDLATLAIAIPRPSAAPGTTFHLDYSFDKVSTVAGQMSNLSVAVNNQTLLSGDYFNNAGERLAIMHIGNISLEPDPSGGFINTIDSDGNPQSALSHYYGITDLWVTRNGRRYGKAVVNRTLATSVVGMESDGNAPIEVINQTIPNIYQGLHGTELDAAFEKLDNEAAAQITTVLQHNVPNRMASASLKFGTTAQFYIEDNLVLARAVDDAAPDAAELRIEP